MKSVLTEVQIGRIADEINGSNITSSELKNDLIDHLCCVVEDGMLCGKDFEAAYRAALQRVCPNGPDEIQNETVFLLTSKSRKRIDRIMHVSGFALLTCASAAIIMKMLHTPFAQIVLMASVCAGVFFFFPTLFIRLYRQTSGTKPVPYIFGFTAVLLLVSYFVFVLCHWPATFFILLAAVVCIYVVLFSLFSFKIFKKIG